MSNTIAIINDIVRDAWTDAMEESQQQINDAEKLLAKNIKEDPWNAKSVLEYCDKYKCNELKEIIENELDKRERE